MLPLFESGIPLARKKLRSLPDADNITIAYPDEGSWKRFHYQFGDYPEVGGVVPLLQRHAWHGHMEHDSLQLRLMHASSGGWCDNDKASFGLFD